MARFSRLVTTMLAATSFLGVAAAADEFDAYFSDIGILQLKPVQQELKVTEGQRLAMNKHADWLNAQSQAINTQVKSGKTKPEDANKLMVGHLSSLKRKVLAELTAPQVKRLREITLQRDGLLPLLDQRMADRIGMTPAQSKKLRDAYEANNKKADDIQTKALKPIVDKYAAMRPKDDAERKRLEEQGNKEIEAATAKIKPQLEQLGKDFKALVDSTLSKGQKDDFEKLKGVPFKPNG
jgi:hypothetical protein